MRDQHKQFFVVGGVDLKSNRVYGDFKLLHREFVLDEPNPPFGEKLDMKKGRPMVVYVGKDKDGKFPEVIVDSLKVHRIPDRYKVEKKDPDGRVRRIKVFDAVPFNGCKIVTAKEFAEIAGITKKAVKAVPKK
jgi:hypothetical protein